jgi:rRNA biogenesis protein RRP5
VTGHFLFDGLLQLSLKPSVLEQKFLKISDVEVGKVVKGTIKKLTDSGLFVSMSGNIDGVVWPNHYADISLKQPSRRFKPGASIKCRVRSIVGSTKSLVVEVSVQVLVVDTDRNRMSLTAKKTLVDSILPILSDFDDVKVGIVTHAVVFQIQEKHLMVEFYNNLKAFVPAKEFRCVFEILDLGVSDHPSVKLSLANRLTRFLWERSLKFVYYRSIWSVDA